LQRTIDTDRKLGRSKTELGGLTLHWDFALILGVLAFMVPVLGRRRVRALLQLHDTTKLDRLSIYASTIAFQWLAAALVLWRAARHEITATQLGVNLSHGYPTLTILVVMSFLFLANQIASVRRIRSDPAALRSETVQLAMKIFPRDAIEQLSFLALVATVAICEEFIYRGFVQYVFQDWFRSLLVGILGSALLFSFAHLYQGKRGLISTFAVGLLFSGVRAWTGSLVPTIVAHFVADLSIGLLAPSHIREALRQASNQQPHEEPPQVPAAH
jgi:membrane protease YdiL (CAAX protease family)